MSLRSEKCAVEVRGNKDVLSKEKCGCTFNKHSADGHHSRYDDTAPESFQDRFKDNYMLIHNVLEFVFDFVVMLGLERFSNNILFVFQ